MQNRLHKAFLLAACIFLSAPSGRLSAQGSSAAVPPEKEAASPPVVPSLPSASGTVSGAQSYPLERRTITLYDASRKKKLEVAASFPAAGGKFPLIIFSHGILGTPDGYSHLTAYWAQHGYVVLVPIHDDSLASLRKKHDKIIPDVMMDVVKEPGVWSNRVRDITFLLMPDTLRSLETKIPHLAEHLDASVVGISGHSLGGYTTTLIAGAVVSRNGKKMSFSDERPRAFIMLSPPGRSEMGLNADSWKNVKRPFMVMTGTNDFGETGDTYEWRTEGYKTAPPGDKYLVVFRDANHFSFTDHLAFDAKDSKQQKIFQYLQRTTLSFWDAYLKGDASAKAQLDAAGLKKQSNGVISLSTR